MTGGLIPKYYDSILPVEKAKYYPTLELAFLISRVFDKEINEVFKFEFEN